MKKNPAVRLRPVEAGDRDFLQRIYIESRRGEFAASGWDDSQIEALLKMQFEMQRQAYAMRFPNARQSVVEFEKTPVGRLIVSRDETETTVVDIAVLSEFQGRGIGAFLIEKLQAEAESLVLRVLKTNRRAVEFYRRCGFTEAGDDDLYVSMSWRGSL